MKENERGWDAIIKILTERKIYRYKRENTCRDTAFFLRLCRFSLRDVTVAIAIFIKRSKKTAIWKWLQKFGVLYLILKRYGIVSGRIRSYVKKVIETIKDRTRVLDHYFPSKDGK